MSIESGGFFGSDSADVGLDQTVGVSHATTTFKDIAIGVQFRMAGWEYIKITATKYVPYPYTEVKNIDDHFQKENVEVEIICKCSDCEVKIDSN